MAHHIPTSLQEIIKRRLQAEFVGRENLLGTFRQNIHLPPDDERRRFIFNIYGQAGVGKTFLAQRLRRIAEESGAITVYTDESEGDVLEVMNRVALQFEAKGISSRNFSERYKVYRQKRQELESDPEVPKGLPAFVGRNLARTGLRMAKRIPVAGIALELVDEKELSDQIGDLTTFIARKLTNKDELHLVLEPLEALTPLFLKDVYAASEKGAVAIFFDTYERTRNFLDAWLRDLLGGRYGSLPVNVVITVLGQYELDKNRWGEYTPFVVNLPLEPFNESEAREYLRRRGVADEKVVETILELSGGLPLLVTTLAAESPSVPDDIIAPSETAIDRFLKWVSDPNLRAAALKAALPRYLNKDVFNVLRGSATNDDLFNELIKLPFLREAAYGWVYHPVVRSPMIRRTRLESLHAWNTIHTQLADHYKTLRDNLKLPEEKGRGHLTWQQYALEALYHQLCRNQIEHLPIALKQFICIPEDQSAFARRWAETIHQAGTDSDDVEAQTWGEKLLLCVKARQDKDYRTVIGIYTSLLAVPDLEDQQRAIALEQRGFSYLASYELPQALADQTAAINLAPDEARHYAYRAFTNTLLKNFQDAFQDISRAIELRPAEELTYLRAWLLLELKQYDEALKDFSTIIETSKRKAEAITARGYAYLRLGRVNDALADFSKAIEIEPDSAWTFRLRGLIYLSLERYQEAISDLSKAVEIDPTDVLSIGVRGTAYLNIGRNDAALDDFNRHIELHPEASGAYSGRAEVYRRAGQYDEALAEHEKAVELEPNYVGAYLGRWLIYAQTGRADTALAEVGRFISHHPDDPEAFGARAEINMQLEQHDEVVSDLNQIIALTPENHFALIYRGRAYFWLKKYDEALQDFNRALELQPDDVQALTGRGMVYKQNERYEEAIVDLSRAIELNPNFVQALGLRAETYQLLEKDDEAIADYNYLVQLESADSMIVQLRGEAYRLMDRHDEALADLNRALELEPDNSAALASRGVTYYQIDMNDEAVADLNRAIELNPEYAWALYYRGLVYEELGNTEEALLDLSRAIDLDPSEADAFYARGNIYCLQEEYEESLNDLTKVIELDQEYIDAFIRRGEVYRLTGNYDEALADLTHALEIDPDDPEALMIQGQTHEDMGHYDNAFSSFGRAIELDPDNDFFINYRGATYLELGRYEEALTDFHRATDLSPENNWYHFNRALTYRALQDSAQAQNDFETVLRLTSEAREAYPDDYEIVFEMALFHLAARNYDDANKFYHEALEKCDDQDIIEQATQNLEYFINLFPEDASAGDILQLLREALVE